MADKRLTHPDYVDLSNPDRVAFTPAGLDVYTRLYAKYGLPLPLPLDRKIFETFLWRILDEQATELTQELLRPVDSELEKTYAEGWLNPGSNARADDLKRLREALKAKSIEALGENVVSLDWRRAGGD